MRYVCLFFGMLSFVLNTHGKQEVKDTLKTYSLGEIVVTATRSRISIKDSPSQMDLLGSQQIDNSNGTTVADVLENSSSVFVRDQGANAALKTLSLRGSGSEQVLVLVNGNRVNSFQNELVDLSLLPLNDIERIEIVHGGNSALYGADALGGVINILTRQPSSDLQVRTEASTGSFGYNKYLLESQGSIGALGLLAGYAAERGRDDFPFQNQLSKDTTAYRSDDDFVRRQFYLHGNLAPDEHSTLELSLQNVNADQGVPGPFDPSTPSFARQSDNDINVSTHYRDDRFQTMEFNINTNFHYSLQTYNDPSYSYVTFYKNMFASLTPQIRLQLSSSQKLIVGGELEQGTLESPDFDSKITRVQRAVYISSESQFDFNRDVLNRISLYQTIRYDIISGVDFAVTPKLGMNVRLLNDGDVRLRASLGQNFRSPSLNDLYYRGFSNPNLKPERSTSFDVGMSSGFTNCGNHNIELTYFHLDIDNRILFDPSTYLPVNIGKAVSNGLEAKYDGHFFDKLLDIGINYSFTDARKRNLDYAGDSTYDRQIIYVPKNIINVSLSIHYEFVSFTLNQSVVGTRFITGDNFKSLPSYRITNANVVLRGPLGTWKFLAKGEINNIFDVDYQVFQQYPMPGRSYRLTLGIEY